MLYRAYIGATDILDKVQVHAHVYDDVELGGELHGLVLAISDTISGTGESDPREWLRDALVALLEAV